MFWEPDVLSRASREVVTLLYRKFLATLAASFLAPWPLPSKAVPLGLVTHAERAYLGQVEASVGSTIYDGDLLSTEIGGLLRVSNIALTLQLGQGSSLTLRRAAGPEDNVQAELGSGTIMFSAGQAAHVAVLAKDASICPVAHAATIAQIRIVNRKELRIYAQRGALNFSYHGETEMVPEGMAYRVLLDPSEKEIDPPSESGQGREPPAKVHAKFALLVIGMVAGGALPMTGHHHHLESPDRP